MTKLGLGELILATLIFAMLNKHSFKTNALANFGLNYIKNGCTKP